MDGLCDNCRVQYCVLVALLWNSSAHSLCVYFTWPSVYIRILSIVFSTVWWGNLKNEGDEVEILCYIVMLV